MGRSNKKKGDSQLFTYNELVKNNPQIFSKQYPKMEGEPENHYICKVYLGEMIRISYPKLHVTYEHLLPPLYTEKGTRTYQPDIYIESLPDKLNKIIYIADIEINGLVHYKNKTQYIKNKIRRETITDYFNNWYKYQDYKIIFSYIVFKPDEFLYFKFDYFKEIFENMFFINGGVWPTKDLYEEHLL